MDGDSGLTIEQLAEQGGVPVRTVRFYISEGLLPRPEGRGKGGWYSREHLLRLRLARLLAERRVPLGEIRVQLERLTLDEVRALLAEEEQRASAMAGVEPSGSPKAYVSALLERARAGRAWAAEGAPSYSRPAPAAAAPLAPPVASGPVSEAMPPGVSRPSSLAETWRRIELAPGVELHVRSDVESRQRGLIDRVLKLAGEAVRRRSWPPSGGSSRQGGIRHGEE